MSSAKAFFALLILVIAASPAAADQKSTPVKIKALYMEYMEDGTLVARGGVDLTSRDASLFADEAVYYPDEQKVILRGGVRLEDKGGGSFSSEELEFDLSRMTGFMKKGSIVLGGSEFRLTGDSIGIKGSGVYEVENGRFTTCPEGCSDWYFAASKMRIREQGYLTATNAIFKIGGIPIFYSPYFFYPIKTERQTGLLIPDIGFTERFGWEMSIPVFITAGESADLTLAPRFFSRNSTGFDGEVRYALPWGGGGEWSGFFIQEEGRNRWYSAGSHSSRIIPGLWLRGTWYDSADDKVPTDYADDFEGRNPGVVERGLTAEYSSGSLNIWGGVTELDPNGAETRSADGLKRTGGGVSYRTGRKGILSGRLTLDAERFAGSDERVLAEPALTMHLDGPEGFSGKLWARLTAADGAQLQGDDSFVIYGIEERTGLLKELSWGTHRIDVSVAAARATSAAFSVAGIRDRRDGSEETTLVSGEILSRLRSKSMDWTLRAGAWREVRSDTTLGYAFSSFEWEDVTLSATLNRDAEYGLILPDPGVASASRKGWTVSADLARERYELGLRRESTQEVGETLYGDFSLRMGKVKLAGSGLLDMDSDELVEETGSVSYEGPCWEIGVTRNRNLAGAEWKLNFSIF